MVPPGEIFGISKLVPPPAIYLVSTETVRNGSMLVWDRATISSLTMRYPRLLENVLNASLRYLTAYHSAHMALINGSARDRLAHVLVSLARGIGQKAQSEPALLENVRTRTYELYESRGREDGHDLDDWLLAEKQVIHAAEKKKRH